MASKTMEIEVLLSNDKIKKIENMIQVVVDKNDRLSDQLDDMTDSRNKLLRDNERLRASIVSARTHLETQDIDALGLDPESGYSYLLEMISSFSKVLER